MQSHLSKNKSFVQKAREFFTSPSGSRTVGMIALFVITLAIPTTLYLQGQNTDNRQRASENIPSCSAHILVNNGEINLTKGGTKGTLNLNQQFEARFDIAGESGYTLKPTERAVINFGPKPPIGLDGTGDVQGVKYSKSVILVNGDYIWVSPEGQQAETYTFSGLSYNEASKPENGSVRYSYTIQDNKGNDWAAYQQGQANPHCAIQEENVVLENGWITTNLTISLAAIIIPITITTPISDVGYVTCSPKIYTDPLVDGRRTAKDGTVTVGVNEKFDIAFDLSSTIFTSERAVIAWGKKAPTNAPVTTTIDGTAYWLSAAQDVNMTNYVFRDVSYDTPGTYDLFFSMEYPGVPDKTTHCVGGESIKRTIVVTDNHEQTSCSLDIPSEVAVGQVVTGTLTFGRNSIAEEHGVISWDTKSKDGVTKQSNPGKTYTGTYIFDTAGTYTVTGSLDLVQGTPAQYKGSLCNSALTTRQKTITVKGSGTTAPTATPPTTGGATPLVFSFVLQGIGEGSKSTVVRNTNPVHKERPIVIELFNTKSQKIKEVTTTLKYQEGSGLYKTTITETLASGDYIIKVKVPTYLRRIIGKSSGKLTQTITSGQINELSQEILVPGDLNNDNFLDVRDYNIYIGCFDAKATTSTCNKDLADINDDGKTDKKTDLTDYNLLIQGFIIHEGD